MFSSTKKMSLSSERAIHAVKQTFESELSEQLQLTKISAPLFIAGTTGIQDDLNGTEKPISFLASQLDSHCEIIHSLAKWKRVALMKYGVPAGEGIYTDMKAIRPDEADLSTSIHSIFVDQWDWEKTIQATDRHLDYLKSTVTRIYSAIKKTEKTVCQQFKLSTFLPKEISFVHAEELVSRWPSYTPKQREDAICAEKKAVFVIGIGDHLSDGEKHDGRAPDYDDWSTETSDGKKGLNGDILVWHPVLKRAFEISSMGIRVDKKALQHQLKKCGCEHRTEYAWHKALLDEKLPASIGGGIGQSRLAMLLLQKKHIGEVQVSIWPETVHAQCKIADIQLLG